MTPEEQTKAEKTYEDLERELDELLRRLICQRTANDNLAAHANRQQAQISKLEIDLQEAQREIARLTRKLEERHL